MKTLWLGILLSLLSTPVYSDENDAIALAAFDYLEGWYESDAEKMQAAIHPELVRRVVSSDGGKDRLEHLGAMSLLLLVTADTRETSKTRKEVVIMDVSGINASIKVFFDDRIEYLHMAKFDGQWLIVNVLGVEHASIP